MLIQTYPNKLKQYLTTTVHYRENRIKLFSYVCKETETFDSTGVVSVVLPLLSWPLLWILLTSTDCCCMTIEPCCIALFWPLLWAFLWRQRISDSCLTKLKPFSFLRTTAGLVKLSALVSLLRALPTPKRYLRVDYLWNWWTFIEPEIHRMRSSPQTISCCFPGNVDAFRDMSKHYFSGDMNKKLHFQSDLKKT